MEFIPQIAPYQSVAYYQSLALRDLVLRKPLNLQFQIPDLEKEHNEVHFIVKLENLVVATSILHKLENNTAKMRQVATHSAYQNKGIGSLLLKYFEQYCLENNFEKIELNARKEAVNFYLKNDYQIVGESFLEVGIEHWKMVKRVSR